jgi:hypothetical protein
MPYSKYGFPNHLKYGKEILRTFKAPKLRKSMKSFST